MNVKHHLKAENFYPRDRPRQPEPTSSPRVSNVTHPSTTGLARPLTLSMKWVLDEFQDVHTRLEQLGRPVTFGMDPTVKLVYHWHTKIKEQLNKMETEGKMCATVRGHSLV